MTLIDHIAELRRRLIWIVAVLVVTMIVGLAFARPIILYLQSEIPVDNFELNVFSPWDTLRIYMQVAFTAALVVTLPFSFYQIWAFMRPGMRDNERKATVAYIPGAFFLFLLGLSFAYFVVFPMAIYFTTMLTRSMDLVETYGIAQYFSFMFNILLPIALVFELPVLVMFLTRVRLLNPAKLSKFRRYAYLILVIVSTLITPPDFISAILVAIPMILLYEFSVFLSRSVHRKLLKEDKKKEEELDS